MKKFRNHFLQSIQQLFTFLLVMASMPAAFAQVSGGQAGWYFTGYSFKDGSTTTHSKLMGTNSGMTDVISFKGGKGNLEITHSRTDDKTGKLLANVKYSSAWSDPSSVLIPGEKYSIDFELRTLSTLTWKAPQQSMHFNLGSGLYFAAADGTKYITKDGKVKLSTEKAIGTGTKGAKRFIQMNFGNGFSATYNYEWRDL